MSDGWIKVRKCLFRHPKVMVMASQTGLCEEVIVGWLCKVWSWADDITADGNVDGITHDDVVRVTGAPVKFLASMQSVGWLMQTGVGIVFPDYEEHMSNSAKQRALNARRNALYRAKRGEKRNRDAPSVTRPSPREEKRRVDIKESKPKKRFVPPSVDQVREYCQDRKNAIDPEAFVDYYEARGWQLKNGSMKCWKAALRTWERNGQIDSAKTERTVSDIQAARAEKMRRQKAKREQERLEQLEADETRRQLSELE